MAQQTDKFLIVIVAGALALVVSAFLVARSQSDPVYESDGVPEGVAHNYLLALQQRDFERAYGYISSQLEAHPDTAEAFEDLVLDHPWDFGIDQYGGGHLQVIETDINGDRAALRLRETRFHSGGLFDSGQTTHTFSMKLKRENGSWRIRHAGSFWSHCLDEKGACERTQSLDQQ
ncbi:MAG: hypothetical protein QF660_04305 [Anaerolineales bacterium]|nr:hypothetical protein [Anaerolineales bacterium]